MPALSAKGSLLAACGKQNFRFLRNRRKNAPAASSQKTAFCLLDGPLRHQRRLFHVLIRPAHPGIFLSYAEAPAKPPKSSKKQGVRAFTDALLDRTGSIARNTRRFLISSSPRKPPRRRPRLRRPWGCCPTKTAGFSVLLFSSLISWNPLK